MSVYHKPTLIEKSKMNQEYLSGVLGNLPAEAILEIAANTRSNLLSLSIQTGFQVFQALLEQELTDKVGPKGKHAKGRTAYRNGYENGSVWLGDGKLPVRRPRAVTLEGHEVPLETYEFFTQKNPFDEEVFAKMLLGASCRKYPLATDVATEDVELTNISRNTISKRFIEASSQALEELLNRPLGGLDIVALFIDGIGFGKDHLVTAAIGVDIQGYKHILGLWEGATENAVICTGLLSNLQERGLDASKGILAIVDGSKALSAAIKRVFGGTAIIQRCQIHKTRNVVGYLPEKKKEEMRKSLRQAWKMTDAEAAKEKISALALTLEKEYPCAATSLREGLDETLAIIKLGLPEVLKISLKSTNIIESSFESVRRYSRNVKHW